MTHLEELHYLFKIDTGFEYCNTEERYVSWLEERLENQAEINFKE